MKLYNYLLLCSILFLVIGLSGCDDEELEQVVVALTSGQGVTIDEASSTGIELEIRTARPVAEASAILLSFSSSSASYGANYTTSPATLVSNQLRIDFAPGESVRTIQIMPVVDNEFTQGHEINISIAETYGEIIDAVPQSFTLVIEDADAPPALATFDFEECIERFGVPAGFSVETGDTTQFQNDRQWGCTDFGEVGQGVDVNAFNGEPLPSNAWLILNINETANAQGGGNIDPSALSSLFFKVSVKSRFSGPGSLRLRYSLDYSGSGNPDLSTWTEIQDFQGQLPEVDSDTWKEVFVSMSEAVGSSQLYIALQYEGATATSATSWTLDNLEISGN